MPAAKTGADSARRAIDLLFAFERVPLATVRELAEAVEMPVPSAHRYVAMLRDMGLVEEAGRSQYRLTMRVIALGHAARRATSLIDVIRPFMQALAEETQETVLLVQPIAGLPVCTNRIEAPRRLRLSFEVGQHLPPLRGASAHLLLAAQAEEDRLSYAKEAIARGELPPVSGIEGFLEEVRRDAERGWAVSREEIDEGVWSAAASIQNEGVFVGTLSVPCPAFLMNDEKAEGIIDAVKKTALQISETLGS
ncbi:IclR family transcriptional regulator [Sinomonas atrocyanea]|jgi:DNA-binding IclR family transcriptional regulator|uniref:IclR family transcriptional regulator n=1 Tax=Sinomonas atrocyanea TaxID=37927 RepID=UPI00277F0C32|nr:IclR family transcriptional regulator [Sinomonas atrocyanea]MDQ0260851.1 DNA-binding IclR family transcriptional regulator [Sinomonas atrocyanea]MDR6621573.1 DNA-binding IclR family transcriptional regulator [Sinomonas atrocyanea]